jgi:hypothetical protein
MSDNNEKKPYGEFLAALTGMFGGEAAIYDRQGRCLAYDAGTLDGKSALPGPRWGGEIAWLSVAEPTVLMDSQKVAA